MASEATNVPVNISEQPLQSVIENLVRALGQLENRLAKVETKLDRVTSGAPEKGTPHRHILPLGRIEGKTYSYGKEFPPQELLDEGKQRKMSAENQ